MPLLVTNVETLKLIFIRWVRGKLSFGNRKVAPNCDPWAIVFGSLVIKSIILIFLLLK